MKDQPPTWFTDSQLRDEGTAKILPYILQELEKLGHDPVEVCRQAGIKNPAIENGHEASAADCNTVFNYACYLLASETRIQQLPIVVTKQVTDMLLYCVISCRDLEEVIERAINYCQLVEAVDLSVSWRQQGDQIEFQVDLRRPDQDKPALLLTLAALSTFYQLFSWITAHDLTLTELGLRCDEPEHLLPLGALSGQILNFGQTSNRMVFPASYLRLPVMRDAEQLRQVIDYFPLGLNAGGETLAARVESLIQTSLGNYQSPISFGAVAQLLNKSKATLRRHLHDSGTNYSQLLERCRLSEAKRLLIHTDVPIKTVALQLGFSDDRAFRRAVKRGLGSSPTQLREHNRSDANCKEVSK